MDSMMCIDGWCYGVGGRVCMSDVVLLPRTRTTYLCTEIEKSEINRNRGY